MKVEITRPLGLSDEQLVQIDLHSFLNILNVLSGDLLLFHDTLGREPFADTLEACYQVGEAFQVNPCLSSLVEKFQALKIPFLREQAALEPCQLESREVREQWGNLHSVMRVLDIRFTEIQARLESPDGWSQFEVSALREELQEFLGAVEKNSLGRYHIVTNVARKQPRDYLVHLDFNGEKIAMPAILKEVMRDLLANARKYTEPGGTIDVGLSEVGPHIRLVVRDNGRGIPEDQLQTVVEFGARGRNVSSHETKGAGFGLTKACWATRQFGGRMWIESELGSGTTVTLEIPRKPTSP